MTNLLPCCGHQVSRWGNGPVYWNPYNGTVQCHKCGQAYVPTPDLPSEINQINRKLDSIIMKNSELAAKLDSVSGQLAKAKDEILAELDALRAADPDLSPEGVAAVQRLGNIAQALDDVIQDAPPEEPPAEA